MAAATGPVPLKPGPVPVPLKPGPVPVPLKPAAATVADAESLPAPAAAAAASLAVAAETQTTLVLRNLGAKVTTKILVEQLWLCGMEGRVDLVHVWVHLKTHMGTGIAYMNFFDPADARVLKEMWQGREELGGIPCERNRQRRTLSVAFARKQGFDCCVLLSRRKSMKDPTAMGWIHPDKEGRCRELELRWGPPGYWPPPGLEAPNAASSLSVAIEADKSNLQLHSEKTRKMDVVARSEVGVWLEIFGPVFLGRFRAKPAPGNPNAHAENHAQSPMAHACSETASASRRGPTSVVLGCYLQRFRPVVVQNRGRGRDFGRRRAGTVVNSSPNHRCWTTRGD